MTKWSEWSDPVERDGYVMQTRVAIPEPLPRLSWWSRVKEAARHFPQLPRLSGSSTRRAS